MLIPDKLQNLRAKMLEHGIDACVIPYSDPHVSEYPAPHWKFRDWLSGFTGSAGLLVVGLDEAGLWTDSRYYLQAEDQLKGTGIELFKEGLPGVPSYIDWLCEILLPGSKVAFNGETMPLSQSRVLAKGLKAYNIQITINFDIVEEIWEGRPALPDNPVIIHEDKWISASRNEKLTMVRKEMRNKKVSHYLTGSLDDIAWVLNLRGTDVAYNPVFHAFLIIEHDHTKLFINPHKLTAQIAQKLLVDEVSVSIYENIYQHLQEISQERSIYFDPERTTVGLFSAIPAKATKVEGISIITQLKAQKNEREVENLKMTLVNDGVAMVEFIHWLEENVPTGKVTELSAAKQLKKFRSQQPNFMGESFSTISGYADHGAIVHYSATEESDALLKPEGLFLIDSGGQYLSGTTDITRTIPLGAASKQAKKDYTLVLKGHIALAQATFPYGSRGVHIDLLARKALWENGLNYGHGTGHGIGYYLNVHEGPQSIRPQDNGIQIEPGMITSNEPGVYRKGEYGIRIENLIFCKEKMKTEFGLFLEFETLTLCPMDKDLVEVSLLTQNEIEWFDNYHEKVYEALEPKVRPELKNWLKEKTAPLQKG
ncbi:MAG TPA: aminopeptidase P family protein [Marinilabiliaceae bacterium]|nr:aminopeptidase P family protein [Marinilabiliaceae bacterium]